MLFAPPKKISKRAVFLIKVQYFQGRLLTMPCKRESCPHPDLLSPSTCGSGGGGGGLHGTPALPGQPRGTLPSSLPRAVVQGPRQVSLLHVSILMIILLCACADLNFFF